MDDTPHIFIVAGEASGDMHGAILVNALRERNPSIRFSAMGGPQLQVAGVNLVENCDKLALVGFTEILRHLPTVFSVFRKLKKFVRKEKPNLVILIDSPGFNLHFAKIAKKAGCKVYYYISPQLWGWRQERVKIIKKYVDAIAVIFPFEVDFYAGFNVTAHFIGHPLLNKVKTSLSIEEAQQKFGIDANAPTVGLLPGSRHSEIARLLPIMVETARILRQLIPSIQFILPVAPTLNINDISPYLTEDTYIKVIFGHTYDVINVCNVAIVASGTATLETALLNVPMAVIYKLSWLTSKIGKMLMKVPYLCICNILAGKEIVREFLQNDAKPTAIAGEIAQLLTDEQYYLSVKQALAMLKDQLTKMPADDPIELALQLLQSDSKNTMLEPVNN